MKYIGLFLLMMPSLCFSYNKEEELVLCQKQFTENYLLKDELNIKSDKMSTLLFEIPDFCVCVVNKRQHEFEERDKDYMLWLFSGKDNRLEKEDLCAQEKLSTSNQLKYFYLVFGLNMKEYIQYRLEEFYLKGIKAIATPDSYFNKLSCLSKNIISNCFKTQSSYISHKCIKEKISSEHIYNIEKECPEFSTLQQNIVL